MIEVRQVDFKEIEKDWRNLEKLGELSSIFQTFDWIDCWWKYLGHRGNKLLLGLFNGKEFVGVAPLYSYKMKIKGIPIFTILGVMGTGESDYIDFVIKRGWEGGAVTAILKYIKKIEWDIFWLSDVKWNARIIEVIEAKLKESNYGYIKKKHTECPYIELKGTFDDYKKTLSKNTRQNAVKFCNRIMKIEHVEYGKVSELSEVESAIRKFIELHQNRWVRVGEQGALSEKNVQEFHVEVGQRLFRFLDLKQLKVNGKVIGTAYSYDFNGSRGVYLPGMDLDYERYSLGFAMMVFGIRDAIECGLTEFDFLRGDEKYKYHFTKTVRNNVAYYFSRSKIVLKIFKLIEGL